MTKPSEKIGHFLRELRLDRMFTQCELAIELNTHSSVVSRIESGKSGNPTWRTMTRWADACDKRLVLKAEQKERAW